MTKRLGARALCLVALFAIALARVCAAQPTDPTLVTIEGGTVRGVATGDVVSWKGVPYAAPPFGSLRWRVPQPVPAWTGVLPAGKFGPSCMQPQVVDVSEDCLTLNVWRPTARPAQPLPVMVWIHGGAMVRGGTTMYPADAVAAQGVIVVSMNYRLGRLGFFAHPALAAEAPGDVRGNYGFMDQRAALLWVQRNIAAFGGDPAQVTLLGESAGGGAVLAHLVSPMSRGLFQRAILQSHGTPGARAQVVPSSTLAAAEKIAVEWSRSVGVKGEGITALAQLRALSERQLIEGVSAPAVLAALSAGTVAPGMAMSIIDGQFLIEPPEAALAAGRQATMPVIVGTNDRDLALGAARSKNELFAAFGPNAGEARKLYDLRGDQTLDELKQQVFADRTMAEPARHLADASARAGAPVWTYRFAYVGESQRGKLMGAPHGFEIPYTFDLPAAVLGDKATPTDKAMGDLVSAYWVSFAKTGDPNGGGDRSGRSTTLRSTA